MTPDHPLVTECGQYSFNLANAVDLVCEFASRSPEHEEALRLDEGWLLEAKRRLDNLLTHLSMKRAA